jgi:hypothetical protein
MFQMMAYAAQDVYLTYKPDHKMSEEEFIHYYNSSYVYGYGHGYNYDHYFKNDIDLKLTYELKFVNNKNYICPVTYDKIILGSKYITCNICNNNFNYIIYEKWIIKNNNCPYCRSDWKNNNIIYINREKLEDCENLNKYTGEITYNIINELINNWITNYFDINKEITLNIIKEVAKKKEKERRKKKKEKRKKANYYKRREEFIKMMYYDLKRKNKNLYTNERYKKKKRNYYKKRRIYQNDVL